MKTYEVRTANYKMGWKLRLALVLLFSGTFFVIRVGWSHWSPSQAERNQSYIETAIESAVVSVLWGLAMSFRPFRLPNYTLQVDEESIIGVTQYTGWMKWLKTRRTVRRGAVRSIFKVRAMGGQPGGIGISERSKFGARMWGFVYVPKSLPEFEDIECLAESWRAPESSTA